jgi:hypothetical protein
MMGATLLQAKSRKGLHPLSPSQQPHSSHVAFM